MTGAGVPTGFHSTKEVSKGIQVVGGADSPEVSIPLRKFPRFEALAVGAPHRRGFHSTKEVSKGSLSSISTIQGICFHSTKEVSKGLRDYGGAGMIDRFHSTKEVSKGSLSSISTIQGICFHSTKEVSKGSESR